MEEVEGVLYLSDHTALGHCHFSFYDKYSRSPASGCIEGSLG